MGLKCFFNGHEWKYSEPRHEYCSCDICGPQKKTCTTCGKFYYRIPGIGSYVLERLTAENHIQAYFKTTPVKWDSNIYRDASIESQLTDMVNMYTGGHRENNIDVYNKQTEEARNARDDGFYDKVNLENTKKSWAAREEMNKHAFGDDEWRRFRKSKYGMTDAEIDSELRGNKRKQKEVDVGIEKRVQEAKNKKLVYNAPGYDYTDSEMLRISNMLAKERLAQGMKE